MDELAKEYEKDFGEEFDVDELAKEYEKDFGEEFDVDELAKEYEKDFGEEFDVDELAKEYEEDFGEELHKYKNIDSQSTVQIHKTSEMLEESQEYEEEQLESDEEIELDPEEYEQNQDPIHDTDEIEFIRDVEELARIMREYTEASGESEEDVKECDNAGFKAEQAYNESREIEQNQEQKEANQEVEEKERELTKEENLEQSAEELSIQDQQEEFEEIEEEFTEIEQEEFEYLWEKYAEYDQEGRSAEEITELMHEAEEAYEVLKRAEEAYNQQEKENLNSINQEEEEKLEEYKKEIETEEELEYFVEAEEKLYAEGKSSQEIAKEMQKVENVYEIKEEVEKIYEKQEKDELKLVDHEEEEDLEDEQEEIDQRDAIEFLIETEEEFHQREKSQEEIDEQMEKIANDYFQNEQEKNQQTEQEKEIIKEIKNVPKELDEKNSEIEEQKKVEQALTQYDERDIEVNLDAEEEVLEEIESDLEDKVNSDSPQEGIIESPKESEDEELKEDEYEKLKQLYRQETGRNPMYAKKETKGFRKWLEEQELKTKKVEEKKEEDEGWKKTLKKWIEESREEEINSELKQILKEILQNFSKYEEFEELLRRYKNAKLTEKEREKLNTIIIKILNKNPIHLQLYYNISGFKAYFQKQHWWNPWLIREIKYKFLNHISKKYEILKLDSQFSREEIKFFKNHGIDWRLLKSRWSWVNQRLLIPFFLEVLYVKNNNVPKTDEIENWGYGRFLKILRENYNLTLSKLVEEAGKTPRNSLKTEKDFSDEEKQFLISKNVNLENLNTRWEWVKLNPQLAIDFYKEILFPKFSRCPTTREIKILGYTQFIEILRKKGIAISNLAERAGFKPRQSYERVLNSDDLTDEEIEFLERYNIKFSDLTSRWSWLDDNPDLAINFFKEVIYPLYNKVPTWNEIAISKYYTFIQKLSSFNFTYPELIKLSGFESNYEFLNEKEKMIINDLMERFISDYFESDQELYPPSLSYIIKYGFLQICDATFGKYAKKYLVNKFGVQEGEKIYSEFWPDLSSGLSDEKKSMIYYYTERFVNDFLDSNNQNMPPPIIHIIKSSIPKISSHTFSKYAQEYLNKRFGIVRGQYLYEKMWPYDFLAAKTGTLIHKIINEFLTIYLKNFIGIKYFSTPAVYPTRKPDGLILKSKKLLLLLKSNEVILKKLDLNLDILNTVKALVFDFTSDVSLQNIVNKIIKYQHPEIFLFIIGYRWYDKNVCLKVPNYRGIIDKTKIRIINIENLWELFSIPLNLKKELKKVLKSAIDRDIDALSQISFLENEELYNTDSLRVELIQKGKIKENIQEFLDLGLMRHPIKNIFTRSELEYIENCKFINHKIAIIDIETTGFNPLKDSIIEIGIVELDLRTGEKKILSNSVIKDPNSNSLKCSNNPFLKDISIDPVEIENAKLLEFYRDILQLIFNSYKITAYNSKFDFRFLENRGFNIPRKLMDVMKVCQKIIIKENSLKFEEVYRHFYNTPQNESKKILTDSNYVSIHRAIDDAIHETELLYYLILEYKFPLTYQKKLPFKEK